MNNNGKKRHNYNKSSKKQGEGNRIDTETCCNLGYIFYNSESTMENLVKSKIKERVEKILDFKIGNISANDTDYKLIFKNNEYKNFSLKTTYPGLLVGIGNIPMLLPILSSSTNGEIKTGFSFDYVTGLPYIPASTVKGIIRSRIEKYYDTVSNWMKNKKLKFEDGPNSFLNELFGSSKGEANINKRDVFFDAVIRAEGREIFEEDYITPHKDMYSGVNPIKILKIKEGIEFEFRFLIRDFEICGLSQDHRFELYKAILKELGVGAKTNVGYGFLK